VILLMKYDLAMAQVFRQSRDHLIRFLMESKFEGVDDGNTKICAQLFCLGYRFHTSKHSRTLKHLTLKFN